MLIFFNATNYSARICCAKLKLSYFTYQLFNFWLRKRTITDFLQLTVSTYRFQPVMGNSFNSLCAPYPIDRQRFLKIKILFSCEIFMILFHFY